MRRLRVPVEVAVGPRGAPESFRWRGRRHAVRAVVAQWVEAVPWWSWRRPGPGGDFGSVERSRGDGRGSGQAWAWRVEAVTRTGTSGTYDLVRITGIDRDAWVLLRVVD